MRRLPGDPSEQNDVKGMIRVDHAGEYGAVRIYAGQLAVMKDSPERKMVEQMAKQEKQHLAEFDKILAERGVRPTILMPLWHIAGFTLGAATALMGKKAALACTAAVESVINDHYANQRKSLENSEPELSETIEKFRKEELEHHDMALSGGAEDAPLYSLLSASIKTASKLAIWLSIRI